MKSKVEAVVGALSRRTMGIGIATMALVTAMPRELGAAPGKSLAELEREAMHAWSRGDLGAWLDWSHPLWSTPADTWEDIGIKARAVMAYRQRVRLLPGAMPVFNDAAAMLLRRSRPEPGGRAPLNEVNWYIIRNPVRITRLQTHGWFPYEPNVGEPHHDNLPDLVRQAESDWHSGKEGIRQYLHPLHPLWATDAKSREDIKTKAAMVLRFADIAHVWPGFIAVVDDILAVTGEASAA